jgi:hypothetical protein
LASKVNTQLLPAQHRATQYSYTIFLVRGYISLEFFTLDLKWATNSDLTLGAKFGPWLRIAVLPYECPKGSNPRKALLGEVLEGVTHFKNRAASGLEA